MGIFMIRDPTTSLTTGLEEKATTPSKVLEEYILRSVSISWLEHNGPSPMDYRLHPNEATKSGSTQNIPSSIFLLDGPRPCPRVDGRENRTQIS